MKINGLHGKLVAVLGYGMEGKATAAYLIKHGVKPVLFDQKPLDTWKKPEQDEIEALGLNFIFGPDCFKELKGFDAAFRSPGVKLSQITNYKLQITSQTKFFFEHCPAKIIGVTGTKGKGTTSALIYKILREESRIKNQESKPYLTGNIGKTQPLDILDGLKPDDWVVYELSSFQLQDLDKSPHIGIVLMVTSEHLDYHQDNQEYVSAKEAITKFQTEDDFAIVNADFESSMKIGELGKGRKLYFSRKKAVEDCYALGDKIILANSDLPALPTGQAGGKAGLELSTNNLALKGRHNLENVCAAILAARCADVDFDAIKEAAINFKGLEHRLEFVTEKNDIKFYNDSFSTTPETAIAAIKAFTEPLIVILGGSSKNSNFKELGKTIVESKNIKALILVGEEAQRIKASTNFEGNILQGAKTMPEIFEQIKSVAAKGDVVLLSPACASFGMFKNYNDRGQKFKQEIEKW